jgi:hypothetical protein
VGVRGRQFVPALPIFCVAALMAATVAGFATATTAPGFVFSVTVKLSDSKLVIEHKKQSQLYSYIQNQGRSATFPRGAQIRFRFVNAGSKTYLPVLHVGSVRNYPYGRPQALVKANRAVAPGGHAELVVTFLYRGSYSLQELLQSKPHGTSVPITVY